ncbi:primosomal protein N' [Agathobacter rectalis]|uniref:Replication restart protein PriA n=1 Tax=Agathobacter rectalis TaxID=39491 RepID=A0A415K030_9FIRM|nr:primosomal protein N' [Agathobacter rectalis]RHL29661.1 primosomal protein N' [Agathobacter rectalis]
MYANVIVDISHEKLDKTFQYSIPDELLCDIRPGVCVDIPFGSRTITGYVIEVTDEPEYDPARTKPLIGIKSDSVAVEAKLIALAAWIRRNYGSTMNQALKTVIPVKKQAKEQVSRSIALKIDKVKARAQLALCEAKKQKAKARLFRALIDADDGARLEYSFVTGKLSVSAATIRALEQSGFIEVITQSGYRNPVEHMSVDTYDKVLNAAQQSVVDAIEGDIAAGLRNTYLIKGVTGSGKTEVYMELIAHCIQSARQAIVLIPEIALTYQTVMRFFARFGNRVSIINSRLSNGERYDQFERAKNGDIDIMIGPRSALFTPFSNLGLIIIDEEHENSYKSESVPRYHAREVAIEYARMSDAIVVLGSATPSVDSYYKAKTGVYRLLELDKRVDDRPLPKCEVVDLRQELREGNRSILSTRLQELMEERLLNGQQTMLFLNRRGKSAFMSCRACGFVVKCPHCDVSLSEHSGGVMVCHYCGYRQPVPKVCPSCGSKYISGFKAGTQKIEAMVAKRFPQARILRMDYDTTRAKDAYEKILQAFSNHEADILIGTQMIVKGHDFSNVTLVGVLAADMSLHVNDFHAAERTFALLTQAAGRAGRGKLPGNVVIQTYDPDHYAIQTAKEQDYEAFYDKEIEYRRLMNYPPVWNMLLVHVTSPDESECGSMAQRVYDIAAQMISHTDENHSPDDRHRIQLIGPADATIAKVNDIYRKVIYMKTSDYAALISIKDGIEQAVKADTAMKHANISFDFNPMSGF